MFNDVISVIAFFLSFMSVLTDERSRLRQRKWYADSTIGVVPRTVSVGVVLAVVRVRDIRHDIHYPVTVFLYVTVTLNIDMNAAFFLTVSLTGIQKE